MASTSTAPLAPPDTTTLSAFLASQETLEATAREVLPFSLDVCSSSASPEQQGDKQPLYSCLTCSPEGRVGVCAACSVGCHASHKLVELFERRSFVCDCSTTASGCDITKEKGKERTQGNRYDKNFKGEFCTCGRDYDPETEEDEMIQCLHCEDWYHTACLLGTPSYAEPPPPLSGEDYDSLVCCTCAGKPELWAALGRYAGREGTGVMRVTKEGEVQGYLADTPPLKLATEAEQEDGETKQEDGDGQDSKKRSASTAAAEGAAAEGELEPSAKRARLEESPSLSLALVDKKDDDDSEQQQQPQDPNVCIAPPPLEHELDNNDNKPAHLFLQEGYQSRWCRCTSCSPSTSKLPSYFLAAETSYEPPDDPSLQLSTEERALQALGQLPREQAIEGALAWRGVMERFSGFLREGVKEGEVVDKAMVEGFFEREKDKLRKAREG